MGRSVAAVAVVVLALGAPALQAQEPSGPPPPSSQKHSQGALVHELLPDIGRIGAEVGVLGGASWNPYEVGQGALVAGFIDLPLTRVPGGKLSYEIFLALSLARSDPFGLGPPPGTFGPTRRITTKLRLLEVAPFSLKYTLTTWDASRLRPYLTAGADVLVAYTLEEPLVGRAPELEDRGIPTGDAAIALGGHAGLGLEVRVSRGLSLNLDYRFTRFEGRHATLQSLGAALGIHW